MSETRQIPRGPAGSMDGVELNFDTCYRAVESKDRRFDGWFVTAVASTGIYCRPSCPAITPKRENVAFHPTAAAAHRLGYRACRRCRPDAAPGSPQWDMRADVVARAMRLIGDGVVDRDGVQGLASRVGYTERHLHRMLVAEVGAGPLALARAQRAQTARTLIETTDMGLAEIAFAAGFGSIRQFNDTVREVYAVAPSELRAVSRRDEPAGPGTIPVRLAYRPPLHAAALLDFLALRAVPAVEVVADGAYARAMRLPHGDATVVLRPRPDHVAATLRLADVRDLAPAVARCRRLLDLDADPVAVDAVLGSDPALAASVAAEPGVRVPRAVDGFEIALRAIVGQQVSLVGGLTLLGRIAAAADRMTGGSAPAVDGDGDGDGHDPAAALRPFPHAAVVAELPDRAFAMPAARAATIRTLAAGVASGELLLDGGADRDATVEALRGIPGIGEWTAGYVAMRALGDPDVFLETDLAVRRAAARTGLPDTRRGLSDYARTWAPWRSYAVIRLWRK